MTSPTGRAGAALAAAAVALATVAGVRWARHAGSEPAVAPGLAEDGAATLVVVLRTSDCGTYRGLMEAWDRLHRRAGLPVVGAVVDGPEADAARDSLTDRLGVSFPLRFDLGAAAEELVLSLGYGLTPLSVLLDGRGRARAVIPALSDPRSVATAARAVRFHHALLSAGDAS